MVSIELVFLHSQQYWAGGQEAYRYVSPAQMRSSFSAHPLGSALAAEFTAPPERTVKGAP